MADYKTPYRELINVLESQHTEADAGQYEVGEQRERNHRYYTLGKLGNERNGRSQYVSPDVFDVVEGKKAFMAECFLSSKQVLRFKPGQSQNSDLEAKSKTQYANLVARKNHYEEKYRDAWHDAFVAKRCVFFVNWEEDTDITTETIEGMPPMQIQQVIQSDPDIVDFDGSGLQADERGLLSGAIMVAKDSSYVRWQLLQPERYYRDPNPPYVRGATYAGFADDLSRGQAH